MKKLIFSAAVAAMTTGAFAGVAQVYDMTINVKTTKCEDGKKLLEDKCGHSFRYYRAQASYKFEGKFWGCGCATIASPIAEQYGMPRLNNGLEASEMTCEDNNNSYMFWGNKAAFHHVDFAWPLLQLVGKKSANVEGFFVAEFFGCEDGKVIEGASLELYGAGYGTANIDNCLVAEEYGYELAPNQIKSMNGSVVGVYNVADLAGMVGCVYCGQSVGCAPFQFCPCVELRDSESAAYGTFTLKFNSSLANKVNNGKYIDEAYCFKDFVKAEFECIEEGKEEPDPTIDDNVTANYKKAVQAVNVAKQGLVVAKEAYEVAYTQDYKVNKKYMDYDNAKDIVEISDAGVITWSEKTHKEAFDDLTDEAQKAYKEVTNIDKAFDDACNDFRDDVGLLQAKTFSYNYAKDWTDSILAYQAAVKALGIFDKKLEYKQVLVKDRPQLVKNVENAKEAMDTAKANFDKQYKADYDDVPFKEKVAKWSTALEAYATETTAINGAYNCAKYDWNNGTFITENGVDLNDGYHAKELKAFQDAATTALETADKAFKDARTALVAAEKDLTTAETACLIVKGTKDCQ